MKFDCAMQHCPAVVTSQPSSVRRRDVQEQQKLPGSTRAAPSGAMYSSIALIHSSPLISRPGFKKCSVGAMSRAPMMPETFTVAVCNAVNRNGVSSSPSTSIFNSRQYFASAKNCENEKDNCETMETSTYPHVLMVGQVEKGLVRPDAVAELHLWSTWRLLANASSQGDNQPRTLRTQCNLQVKRLAVDILDTLTRTRTDKEDRNVTESTPKQTETIAVEMRAHYLRGP